MNTPVSFKLAKLLKEKGFDESVKQRFFIAENIDLEKFPFLQEECALHNWNDYDDTSATYYSAPTLAEAVCWIYSKYDIWISLIPDSSSEHRLLDRKFSVSIFRFNMNLNVQAEILRKDKDILYFNLPENAFTYAINHILNTYKPTS